MGDRVRTVVTEMMAAWNAHDAERVAAFCAADYEGMDVAEATPQRGPEAMRRTVQRYCQAFPDLCFNGEETVIDGERVVLAWTARGTHQGSLMNIPATGRPILVRGISLLTIREGKVARGLYVWDVAGLLREIGLLPELP